MSTLAVVLGIVAAAAAISNSVPQAVKIWRSGSDIGVNVAMWVLYLTQCCVGAGYGLRVGNPLFVVANSGTFLTSASVIVAISRVRRLRLALALACLALGTAVLLGLTLVLPMSVVSPVLVAGSGLAWMQASTSFRTWRRAGDSEVSITTFGLRVVALAAWAGQAVVSRDLALFLLSLVSLCAVATTMVLELLAARRRSGRSSRALAQASADAG